MQSFHVFLNEKRGGKKKKKGVMASGSELLKQDDL